MKKSHNICMAFLLSFGLIACGSSTSNTPEASVKTFLDGMKEGSYEKTVSVLDSDIAEEFESTYSYYTYYGSYFDLSNLNDEAKSALNNLDDVSLKTTCTDYTIGEITEVSESEYTVEVTITGSVYDSVDTTDVEEELSKKYAVTDEDIQDLDENEQISLVIKNISNYSIEIVEYVLENAETEEYTATFTVIKSDDNEWLIESID